MQEAKPWSTAAFSLQVIQLVQSLLTFANCSKAQTQRRKLAVTQTLTRKLPLMLRLQL